MILIMIKKQYTSDWMKKINPTWNHLHVHYINWKTPTEFPPVFYDSLFNEFNIFESKNVLNSYENYIIY